MVGWLGFFWVGKNFLFLELMIPSGWEKKNLSFVNYRVDDRYPYGDTRKDWSFPTWKLHRCWVVVSSTPPLKSVLSFASLMRLLSLQLMGCCWWVAAKCLLGYGAELGFACFAVFVWHFTVTWWAGLFPARLQLLLFVRLVSLSLSLSMLICVCVCCGVGCWVSTMVRKCLVAVFRGSTCEVLVWYAVCFLQRLFQSQKFLLALCHCPFV